MATETGSKRHSTASKVATPRIPEMNTLDAALVKAVGLRVKVTTSASGKTLEGTLFTACAITNCIAINTAPVPPATTPSSTSAYFPGDYHIIPVSQIQNILVGGGGGDAAAAAKAGASAADGVMQPLSRMEMDALRKRAEDALRDLKKKEEQRGRNVTREAQEVFDFMSMRLPSRWHGQDIIVNDAVIIKPPYNDSNCVCPPDKQRDLDQVRKHLAGFYAKKKVATSAGAAAKQQGGNRPGVATPIPPRKGG
ncbi:anticodon-binding domain-containing protein [Lineolata rhizophorae]|uniref:Anticodon-binding domain-containing protein n=1 Tax=Lineolata rhizophorae TaxID=578093 RepID=A0A6A6NV27_9PEZI|nr:anticodon-binding domain-containing protein [Lineolata rhizophorae]